MEILTFTPTAQAAEDKNLGKCSDKLSLLISDLKAREIPEELVGLINEQVNQANAASGSPAEQRRQVRKAYNQIMKLLSAKLKLVPKGYYRTTFMPLGMVALGLPFGVAFGMAIDNPGLLGIGLPIGMVLGMVIGSAMDNKAAKQGRQLDVSL